MLAMQANPEKPPAGQKMDPAKRKISLTDVGNLSGEELILCFGTSTPQQLVDLIVAAIRMGDDDTVAAIDGRLQEVERLLHV
jgi:hypothetical protein